MSPRGKITLQSALLLLGLAVGIYASVLLFPLYMDHLDVVNAVREGHSKGVANNGWADIQIRNFLFEETRRIGTHWELDEAGDEVEVRGLGLDDESVEIERDEQGWLSITVTYHRKVQLAPLRMKKMLTFRAYKEGTRESR